MSGLGYIGVALICPLVMGAMMVWMMRGMARGKQQATDTHEREPRPGDGNPVAGQERDAPRS